MDCVKNVEIFFFMFVLKGKKLKACETKTC
ncbi:hypothetical protein EDC17_103016 [Sphingobacterium alimentarium]|jgi:hypothetical protein|uniref:Uncharacterized protein n=1 Tax=Sphingobacterium alimentarium TaxID=797292 RepID=A0A4R3VV55_9SPHI|nr:hypothetical protein EDC17_103016 [Sphingobacterium alimentarium]